MSYRSLKCAPRKSSKLHKLVCAMVESKDLWTYSDLAEFGFKLNHTRDFDKVNDRGYWSVNIRWAKDSYFIAKNPDGLYYVTECCKRYL